MDRRVLIVAAVLIVAVAALNLSLSRSRSGRIEEGIYVGMRAPDLIVTGVDGSKFKLSDHRGEIVVLEFSTMWCPYCSKQIEALKELVDEFGEDICVVSIDIDPSGHPTGDWVRMMGITWFYGHSPEAGLAYKVSYVPTVIIVDREGVIRYRGAYTSYDRLRLLILQIGG